jgi:hypothetical protein
VPLYDLRCARCGVVREKLYPSYRAMREESGDALECGIDGCKGYLEVLPSMPSFVVNGFSNKNGYSGGQTYEVKVKEKDMRVVVKS